MTKVIIIQTCKGFRITEKYSDVGYWKFHPTLWDAWHYCNLHNWKVLYVFKYKPFPVILAKFADCWELIDGDSPVAVLDTFEEAGEYCEEHNFKVVGVNF